LYEIWDILHRKLDLITIVKEDMKNVNLNYIKDTKIILIMFKHLAKIKLDAKLLKQKEVANIALLTN